MALYLVQHGLSLPEEKDPGKGLSKQGIEETRLMAEMAAERNLRVSRILHSGKKRALQTAEIFTKALEQDDGIYKGHGLAPLDDVTAFAATVNPEENIMVVGHLPFMERLTAYLVTGSTDKVVVKFQNSGIVCLDTDGADRSFFIRWAIFPNLV